MFSVYTTARASRMWKVIDYCVCTQSEGVRSALSPPPSPPLPKPASQPRYLALGKLGKSKDIVKGHDIWPLGSESPWSSPQSQISAFRLSSGFVPASATGWTVLDHNGEGEGEG